MTGYLERPFREPFEPVVVAVVEKRKSDDERRRAMRWQGVRGVRGVGGGESADCQDRFCTNCMLDLPLISNGRGRAQQ